MAVALLPFAALLSCWTLKHFGLLTSLKICFTPVQCLQLVDVLHHFLQSMCACCQNGSHVYLTLWLFICGREKVYKHHYFIKLLVPSQLFFLWKEGEIFLPRDLNPNSQNINMIALTHFYSLAMI